MTKTNKSHTQNWKLEKKEIKVKSLRYRYSLEQATRNMQENQRCRNNELCNRTSQKLTKKEQKFTEKVKLSTSNLSLYNIT